MMPALRPVGGPRSRRSSAGVQGADTGGVELGHQLVQGHRDHDRGATPPVRAGPWPEPTRGAGSAQCRAGPGWAGPGRSRSAASAAHCERGRVRRSRGSSWSASARAGRAAGTVRGRCLRRPPTSSTSYAATPRPPPAPAPGLRTPRPPPVRSPRRPDDPGPATPSRHARPPAPPDVSPRPHAARPRQRTAPSAGAAPTTRRSRDPAPTLTRPAAIAAARTSMLLDLLRQTEVGAGLAAYLPRLDRDPVRSGAGTGLDRGLTPLGVGEQPQREGVELRSASGEGDQGRALVLGRIDSAAHRPGSRGANQPVGEVEHRVEVLDRLAAHGEFKHRALTEKGL